MFVSYKRKKTFLPTSQATQLCELDLIDFVRYFGIFLEFLSMSSKAERNGDVANPASKRRKLQGPEINNIDDAESDEDLNFIISNLSLPDSKTAVAVDHANHVSNTEVQAYAKLAGPTWTYYVQMLSIVIGRTSDNDDESVQIDLSPSKVVSRRHACIQYNLKGRFWEMSILGRNGVRIDRVAHKDGSVRLYSGNILDIGGVQMMFVLPDVTPQVAPNMKAAVLNQKNALSPNGKTKGHGHTKSLSNTFDSDGHLSSLASAAAAAASSAPSASSSTVFDGNGPPVPTANMPYPKGVAIITRPQVRGMSQGSQYIFDQDLSSDDAKDIKPPYSYATMITQAIMSTNDMMMSLSDIYDWISSKYSFYRHSRSGWQNSIRHNLSLNKAFEKVPRKANEPGKGMKWQITPQFKEEFIRKASCGRLIKGRSSTLQQRLRDSPMKQQQKQFEHVFRPPKKSSPSKFSDSLDFQQGSLVEQIPVQSHAETPVPVQAQTSAQAIPSAAFQQTFGRSGADKKLSDDTDDDDNTASTATYLASGSNNNSTAPRLGYATPKKPKLPYDQHYNDTYGLAGSPSPPNSRYLGVSQLEAYTPDRGSSRTNSNAGQGDPASPTNKSDIKNELKPGESPAARLHGNGKSTLAVAPPSTIKATPARTRLQLAPPSATQQLPSSFMPASSPAPFWKLMQLSTPVRGGDLSPSKYSSPPSRDDHRQAGSDDVLGDLQDVDLTRGFRQIGNWRGDNQSTGERPPEQLKS